jgi:hypothetical protein
MMWLIADPVRFHHFQHGFALFEAAIFAKAVRSPRFHSAWESFNTCSTAAAWPKSSGAHQRIRVERKIDREFSAVLAYASPFLISPFKRACRRAPVADIRT